MDHFDHSPLTHRKRVGLTHPFRRFVTLFVIFALLVGYSTGGLAGRLARSLAFATATVGRALLQSGTVQSLDMGHEFLPPIQ